MTTTTSLIPTEKVGKVTRNKKHQYQHEDFPGETWVGVTTALAVIAKPALVPWARNVALEDVRQALLDDKVTLERERPELGEDWEEYVARIIEQARKRPDQVRDEAADFGTRSHELIAAYLKHENPEIPEEFRPMFRSFLEWHSYNDITIHMAETIVYSETYRYGGTVDAIAERDGKLVVIDWKTSNSIYNDHAVQVGGYALALGEMTGGEIDEAWIVRFGKKQAEFEGKQVKNLDHAKEGFLSALALHRTLKERLI